MGQMELYEKTSSLEDEINRLKQSVNADFSQIETVLDLGNRAVLNFNSLDETDKEAVESSLDLSLSIVNAWKGGRMPTNFDRLEELVDIISDSFRAKRIILEDLEDRVVKVA